jgi:predicted  nucleic acid-binding Zn-ribbon protein
VFVRDPENHKAQDYYGVKRFSETNENMPDFEGFDQAITKVIKKLDNLKKENLELKSEVDRLKNEFESKSSGLVEIEEKLALAEANCRDFAKEEAIRKKITGLLEKVDSIEL